MIKQMSAQSQFRIGYEYNVGEPNALPCFMDYVSKTENATLFRKQCNSPGMELEFLQLLLRGLNLTDSYLLLMYNSTKWKENALYSGELDILGQITRPDPFNPATDHNNMTISNAIWSKEYCFAFIRADNLQLLANFSPYRPFSYRTWILVAMTIVTCVTAGHYTYGPRKSGYGRNISTLTMELTYLGPSQLELLFLQTSCPNSNRISYNIVSIVSIGFLGITYVTYASKVASQMVSQTIPSEVTTIDKFFDFVKQRRYQLFSDDAHHPSHIKVKFFHGPKKEKLFNLFKTNSMVKLERDSDGRRMLKNPKEYPFVNMETFMHPINIYKGRYLRAHNHDIKIICLYNREQFPEAMLMKRNLQLNELVNRFIERSVESGLVQLLKTRYGGPELQSSESGDTPETLKVRLSHYRSSMFGLLFMNLVASLVLLVEVCRGKSILSVTIEINST